jgi:hypothetical protein
MISSEVQRTLVKSPPELWAELSSPDGLARHLGELGEIRITATEPESRVEWQAENTTGTVLIKPSGWGTKVTLSVTRELAPPAPQAAADADAPAPEPPREDHLPAPGADPQPDAPAAGAELPQAPDAAVETAGATGAELQEGVQETDEAATPRPHAEPAGEILLRPHTAAGRWEAQAVWHEQAAAFPERPPAQAQRPAHPLPEAEAQAPAACDGPGFEEPEGAAPAPRPGFFARLFRRRGAAPAIEVPEAEPETDPPADERVGDGLPEDAFAPGEPAAEVVAEVGGERDEDATEAPDAGAIATPSPTAVAAALEEVPAPEPPAESDPGPDEAQWGQPPRELPNAAEGREPESEPPPAAAERPAPAAEHDGAGISAELAAAEEAATADVTAVLTAALDRLGAAHHRPFSRA